MTDRLLARYGAEVWILSNVEAMTLGEMSVGSAVGISDLVYLKLGKGLVLASSATAAFIAGLRAGQARSDM